MSTWPEDELRRIAETDDLHVSPFRSGLRRRIHRAASRSSRAVRTGPDRGSDDPRSAKSGRHPATSG